MARLMIGSEMGICAVDKPDDTILATVVSDGANNVVVSAADRLNLRAGMVVDIVNKTTGAVLASARTIQSVDTVTNTVTYTGADVTATTSHGLYLTGQWELAAPTATNGNAPNGNDAYANVNGGLSPGEGWGCSPDLSIQAMRDRLNAINSTTYSAAELDKMTYNDMLYAIRVNDFPGSIK